MKKIFYWALILCLWSCSLFRRSSEEVGKTRGIKEVLPLAPKNTPAGVTGGGQGLSPKLGMGTVDALDSKESTSMPVPVGEGHPPQKRMTDTEQLNGQMATLFEAGILISGKRYDQALELLTPLKHSSDRQIQVRAKFLKGEILFQQEEYDLAMQVFEDLIAKYAFSGVILKALNRLVTCAEKLALPKKKRRYHSILYDFFESV